MFFSLTIKANKGHKNTLLEEEEEDEEEEEGEGEQRKEQRSGGWLN